MNYSITQNGKPLDKSKYTIDEKSKTFSSNENNLVLDFNSLNNWTFKTGGCCTFKTDDNCTFNTGYSCTFNTGNDCTFNTGYNCTFNTGYSCTFNTGYNCTFNTGYSCTFNIYDNFKSIQTKGNSNILITDKKIHDYLEDEVIVYFEDNKLLYTENKLSREKYKMVKELVK